MKKLMESLPSALLGTLRRQLIISVALVHAVLMTLFVIDLTKQQQELLLERQSEQSLSLAHSLAISSAGWLSAHDLSGLQELVDAQAKYPELVFGMLTDLQGHVMAHSDHLVIGLYVHDLPSNAQDHVFSRTPALVDVAVPAMLGSTHVGWARVGIGQTSAGLKQKEITYKGVIYSVAAIVIGSILAWFMGRRFTRRLYSVQRTIEQIQKGNTEARTGLTGVDEAAQIARAFDEMLDSLARRDAELMAGERKYRSLIESIRTAVVVCGPDGHILTCNSRASCLLGVPADEMIGLQTAHPVWRLLNEDGKDLDIQDYPVNRVLRLLKPLRDYTVGIIRPNSQDTAWALVNADPEFDEHGNIVQVVVTFVDITRLKAAEQALKESEDRYRTLVENLNDIVFSIDTDGRVTYISPVVQGRIKYSQADIVGQFLSRFVHPDDAEKLKQRLNRVIYDGESGSSEYRFVDKQGEVFYVVAQGRPMYKDGRVVGITGLITDITERKRVGEALRQSEQFLGQTEKIAGLGGWRADPIADTLYCTQGVHHILKTPADYSPTLEQWMQFFTPESVPVIQDMLRKTLEQGTSHVVEAEVMTADGKLLWTEVRSLMRVDESEGHHVLGTLQDITDRKRAEQDRIRLATAIEQAAETVIITDVEGGIVYVNPAFELTTGYSREEALGANPRILKSGSHDHFFYRNIWETILSGNVWRGRVINRKKDGTLFEEEATISPVKDYSGKIVNFVAVKRDVTKEVSLQKQLLQAQKMEAIGTLAGGIAHDFNNLLQVVMGYSDLLLIDMKDKPKGVAALQSINLAARRGSDMVKQILTFSRKVDAEFKPVDLNQVVEDTEKLLRRTIPKAIDLQLILEDNLVPINADAAQIQQVLMNLALNSKDAMPTGGKLIFQTSKVQVGNADTFKFHIAPAGEYVLLEVTDTGIGMPKKVVERIFEPFFTTKGLGEGTGLGLAVVYGIVQGHRGHIHCESEPQVGTTFKVYLPIIERVTEERTADEETLLARSGNETVLVIDDEKLTRDLARALLVRGGYCVIEASGANDGLRIIKMMRRKISLVLLDLSVPGMGVKTCLEEILEADPEVKVLAAGSAADISAKGFADSGARGYVTKPFTYGELLNRVRKIMDEA